ncbi:MAG: thylakoid membrane photosystem I accumulation factor [Synechococcales bacterium]|nr:thylakoid membrane photosystem I accumulation factor [Synechococcales bacterium]
MLWSAIAPYLPRWQHLAVRLATVLTLLLTIGALVLGSATPAQASLTDDRYDGNIFPLYAGNGSLVPPRLSLKESMRRDKPTLLVLYADDSKDCKAYSSVLSQLDAFYGRAADFVFLLVDALPVKESYEPTEPGYYFQGFVPQTVLFNQAGDVVLNRTGITSFEELDDAFRDVFDLLPRSESVERRRRAVNEVNTELVPEEK